MKKDLTELFGIRFRPILASVAIFMATFFCSCNPLSHYESKYHKTNQITLGEQLKGNTYSIVVLHSYNDMGQEGNYFRKLMDWSFKKHGVTARIHHIYLDLIHSDNPEFRLFGNGNMSVVDSVFSFKPDIILINDDLAFNYILEKKDTLVRTVPVVFAGVSAPGFNRASYPLMTGLRDPIDLATNCNLLKNVYGLSSSIVEIDKGGYQDVIREQLNQSISDTTLFMNNSQFSPVVTTDVQGRLMITFVSMADLESNRPDGSDESRGLLVSQRIKANSSSSRLGHIQVKYDIFSNGFLDLNDMPQVTAIREQFSGSGRSNNERRSDRSYDFKRTKFLCGYFASVETQVVDQVHYALRILQGENPLDIPIEMHQKEFMMDWNAMQQMTPKLDYSDFKDQFSIVNVPFKVEHVTLYYLLMVLALLAIAFLVAIEVHMGNRRQNKAHKQTLEKLKEESRRRLLVLEDSDTVFVTISDNRISFIRNQNNEMEQNSWPLWRFRELFVDKGSFDAFDVCTGVSFSDHQKSKVRIKANFLGRGWHWWEMSFRKYDDRDLITGFAVNIDKTIEYEDKLKESAQRAEEVASKENFIANITHDIRTPLNAISGFAQLLAEGCSYEDRCLYSNLIKDNTGQLLNLIDEAVRKPSDSVDSMSFKMRDISTSKLLNDSYQTNRILCPSHLEFKYEPYRGTDVLIKADSVRTSQVINNFLSNAFKYTINGSVTLGWTVIHEDNCIEVYVSDTGIGISEADAKIVEQRFSTVRGNYKGTGLGLDICRTVIEKQNGQYGFTSRVGEGSRFWFRLPLSEIQAKA